MPFLYCSLITFKIGFKNVQALAAIDVLSITIQLNYCKKGTRQSPSHPYRSLPAWMAHKLSRSGHAIRVKAILSTMWPSLH